MVPEVTQTSTKEEKPFYVAPEVLQQLMRSKEKVVRGDLDRIFIVDGGEGGGKSTLALQLAYTLDPTFCLADIVFDGDSLQKRIRFLAEKGIKHKSVVFDEAFNGLSSKSALSKMNKQLVRLFMEMRQLNLFVFIVLPSFFLLEKYIALFRSNVLFHVYVSKKDAKRRYYRVYNRSMKKNLYILGQKMFSYSRPFNHLSYRFYAKLPPTINKEEYLKKKLKSFHEDEQKQVDEKWLVQRDFMIRLFYEHTEHSYKGIENFFQNCKYPMTYAMVGLICKNTRKKGKTLSFKDSNR